MLILMMVILILILLKKLLIKTKNFGIFVPHMYGNPCEMDKIKKLTNKFSIYLIEDCAQSLV